MSRVVLLFALCLSACASSQGAPIAYGGGAWANAPRPAPPSVVAPPDAAPPRAHPSFTPAPDAPLAAYGLQPDDVQPYDPLRRPRTHRVGANESLHDIAVAYQVPVLALIDSNALEPPYALNEGQVVRVPPPQVHVVAAGETFAAIARLYNIDPRSLALFNRLPWPAEARVGQRLALPIPAAAEAEPPPQPNPARSPIPAPAPIRGEGPFAAPLRGTIVAHFGAQPGGARLDGIEIAGREGDEIKAAADGEVVYAGADLPSYGVLVLIRHGDNYVTAYAYTRRALVREGQRVRAGQAIAELGPRSDGQARLMFQVRRGANAVDPEPLMRGG
jgi:murein DD-endopeptidase MepM/ murein hydrolase activator NlpD